MKQKVQKTGSPRYGVWQEETARFGRCWRYDIRIINEHGKTVRRTASGFATKAECETAVAALRLASRENKFGLPKSRPQNKTTVGTSVETYLKMMRLKWEAKNGSRYLRRNTGQLNPVLRWAEFTGKEKAVKSLTKQDFFIWAQSEIARGVKPSSVQRRLNNIRAALNYAIEVFEDLKDYKIPKYSLGKASMTERMRVLEKEEIQLLAEKLKSKPVWRDAFDFFKIALATGGRFDEIIPTVVRKDKTISGIKWSDTDVRNQTIRLYSGKTGKERIIYAPAAVEILSERKKHKLGNSLHAFDCRDHHIRKIFAKVSKECGIAYGQKTSGGWTPHDLRHTCLTNLLQSGVDIATVRDFAGHSSLEETSKYVHSTEKSKLLAASACRNLLEIAC